MELSEEEIVQINDLRKRIISGEEVKDEELKTAIASLRANRATSLIEATQKKQDTVAKKQEKEKKLADVKDMFGL